MPLKRKSATRPAEKQLPRSQKRAKQKQSEDVEGQNGYKGWAPSGREEVERRAFAELQPKTFWMKYVRQRRPVVLTGGLESPELAAVRDWTLDHLAERAGNATVSVEKREGVQDSYGRGHRVRMPFKQLARALESGEQNLYLTTQEEAGHEAEREALAASPVRELLDELPLPPSIMGSLIPQTINLWLGSSAAGASSGLHHDYHDNLYMLLRGAKTFQLWSPAEARRMYTHGVIARVHANGRIVYSGQGEVGADGSRPAGQASEKENVKAAREAEPSDADSGSEEEKALQEALARFEDGCGSDDDYSGSEAEAAGDAEEDGEPPSFSRIDLSRPPSEIAAAYPDFLGLAGAITCTLHAGDMLYLPAGWFHNVTSCNVGQGGAPLAGETQYHLALNYWFHPPDNLDALSGFKRPYMSRFWPELWAERASKPQKR